MIARLQRSRESPGTRLRKAAVGSCSSWAEISAAEHCEGDRVCSLNQGKLTIDQNTNNHQNSIPEPRITTMFSFQIAKKQEHVTHTEGKGQTNSWFWVGHRYGFHKQQCQCSFIIWQKENMFKYLKERWSYEWRECKSQQRNGDYIYLKKQWKF